MEKRAFRIPGFVALLLVVVLAAVAVVIGLVVPGPATAAVASVLGVIVVLGATGFVVVNPNDAQVVQFFGRYVGSIREAGFHWTWPLTGRRRITLRVRNFETAKLKVSDADGNPVEIAARQQASAIVAARFKIVDGAVGMVSSALEKLREQHVVELDEERKAQMVANLLVVLCGDRSVSPVVNAGTLY